ncbi:MAG: hypothetical protein ACI4UO_04165, partial [Paludibacteraceae bacterium]
NAAGSGMQGTSSQSRSAQGNAAGGNLSAPVLTVSLPTYTLAYTPSASLTADPDQQAAAAAVASAQWQQHTTRFGSGALLSSPVSSPYGSATGVSTFLSADDYLAYSNGNPASTRYRAAPNNGGAFARWLASIVQDEGNYLYESGGVYYFSEADLRVLYEAAQASGNFPGISWETFLSWFTGGQGENAIYQFPVGEPWALIILAMLYAAYILWRRTTRTSIRKLRIFHIGKFPHSSL